MTQRIVIDPITRIEGHLRIDVEVDQGAVTKAWSSGQMWRGIEVILKGRDPRDAWAITQRICGVCTTVHALASVRAVENALDLPIPKNAQYIRNLIVAAHGIHDHLVHFYHLAALDWVDIVSALSGTAEGASQLAESLSDYEGNSRFAMQAAKDKLTAFVDSGQLGIYASGYWGHPAMTLPPDANLMAATHYLQALEVQRIANKIVSILGSKSPHVQNLTPGGVTNAINMDSQSTLTLERLYAVKKLIDDLGVFIHSAMMSDVAAVGALYADWTGHGKGITNYLSVPDMPLNEDGTEFAMPGGWIPEADLSQFRAIENFHDPFFKEGVKEAVTHSWYDYDGGAGALHPFQGETTPNYTDFQDEGKYSWIKAPTFYDERAQVGPLANVLAMANAGHASTQKHLDKLLTQASAVAGTEIPLSALHSTVGRIAARAVRCAALHDELVNQWTLLMENITSGDTDTFNRPVFPKGEVAGVGFHEAPRGVLSHWVVIEDGKIENYQCVVPSTWNAGPRDDKGRPGPYEASLIGNPVADPELPLEVLRTVHSFDPCISCAIHMADPEKKPIVQVKAF